jgi:hypothetical protein
MINKEIKNHKIRKLPAMIKGSIDYKATEIQVQFKNHHSNLLESIRILEKIKM